MKFTTPAGPIENPQNVNNPLSTMQPGEQVICEIKRTNIGLVGVYFNSLIVVLVVAAVVILVPHFAKDLNSQIKALLIVVFFIVAIFVAAFTYVSTIIYKANRWILTGDSLTQISRAGLFRKQTSQLSLANLEDVTAEQNGVLQSMFHFGNLRAETAGERSKFVFRFCPTPNACAQQILMARENFIRREPGSAKRANDQLNVPDVPIYNANDPASNPGV